MSGSARRVGRSAESRNDGVAVWVGEVDVETTAPRKIGRKRQPEESTFTAAAKSGSSRSRKLAA